MDLGLGNLKTLKDWLLAESLRNTTDYDDQITIIGRAAAERFEVFCNRKFARVSGDTFECSADREHLVLPRYPLEVITTIEQKDTEEEGWVTLTMADVVVTRSLSAGLIHLVGALGQHTSRLRITYTGGFWFDTTEDSSGSMPVGAMPLPNLLRAAWLKQCEHEWQAHDKLGKAIAEDAKASPLAGLNLTPEVQAILRGYVRFN
jgi:hypothetical protein